MENLGWNPKSKSFKTLIINVIVQVKVTIKESGEANLPYSEGSPAASSHTC